MAPSPTGDPHVGTAYVALANLAFAKKHGGDFILRIEDTDQARSTAESEHAILAALRWIGVTWDEGPDVGGPHGPYRQSERSAIYARYAERAPRERKRVPLLLHARAARGDALRAARRGDPAKVRRALPRGTRRTNRRGAPPSGEPFVVRMKVPESGVCVVDDLARGPVPFEYATVDMQVLLKSDGLPTYHLANVVDDHLMEITHVIRGEEWMSSAPKHLLLYSYLGWDPPVLMHMPLLRNPDKSKLSKRKNPTGILFYERMGYLPEALLNFLGILLAHAPEGQEIFGLHELIERIDLEKISLGGPVFDVMKLDWLNKQYLHTLDARQLLQRAAAWGFDDARVLRIAELARTRVERLSDLAPATAYLFAGRIPIAKDDFAVTKFAPDELRMALALAMWRLDAEASFDMSAIERVLKSVGETLGKKFRDLTRVYYVAISGSPTALPLFDSMELLGRDMVRERLRVALAALGGVSAKEQKSWLTAAPPRPDALRPSESLAS